MCSKLKQLYYKVAQALLQSKGVLRYYKTEIKLLQSEACNLLQSQAAGTAKEGSYYNMEHFFMS